MNIACIGGGPTGLYYAILHKKHHPADRVIVLERNRPDDTFGWGVVFSDATVRNLNQADERSAANINESLNHWDDIEIRFKGHKLESGGHGFIGIGRLRLLNILQERCEELGVELVYETNVVDDEEVAAKYGADLIIASDGVNSFVRKKYEAELRPDIDLRLCRFAWFGTRKLFDAFTFIFEKTQHGWMAVHAYRFNRDTSTFIVEMPEEVWLRAGFDQMEPEDSIAYCEKLFAGHLDGHKLLNNAKHLRGSANWLRFPRVVCPSWHTRQTMCQKEIPVVLMGDASHTAHFSIGSGTKLGLEDAISFDGFLRKNGKDLEKTLAEYETERRVQVARIQSAAANSTWWFENVAVHENLPPKQFFYSLLTRSQRLSHQNLRLRDGRFVGDYETWFSNGKTPSQKQFAIGGLNFSNRCAREISIAPEVSQSVLEQSLNALQAGAGMVICKPENLGGDIFFHEESTATSGKEWGEAWTKAVKVVQGQGSLAVLMLNYPEDRLEDFDPAEKRNVGHLSEQEIGRLPALYQTAAVKAEKTGADMLCLNFSDGGLVNRFLSPLTNFRKDDFGGSPDKRRSLAFKIAEAVKNGVGCPLVVKLNASERVSGGIDVNEAVQFALGLKSAGIDMLMVSSDTPELAGRRYGRMFNGCFADEIRNKVNLPVIMTGNILDSDQVDTIVASGRADFAVIDENSGRMDLAG